MSNPAGDSVEPNRSRPAAPPDEDLVREALAGESGAFDQLVERYQRRATSVAYRLLGNLHDALEVCQEAFVRAYRNLQRLEDRRRFGPWLLRIVTNLSLNFRRDRAARGPRISLEDCIRSDDRPREERGDMDESVWEKGNDDLRKDPWAETTTLPLKDPVTSTEFIFTTSSKGGRAACGKLASAYGEQRHRQDNVGKLPVIKLDASTYKHRKLNQVVHFPVFRLVEWRSEAELINGKDGASGATTAADNLNDEVPF